MIVSKLYIVQFLLFTSAIILLSILNLSGNSVEIKRPVILLIGSVFALFNSKKNDKLSIIAKIILLYIIEMFFDQLSRKLVHIGTFSIHLSLLTLIPMAVSFICSRFHQSPLAFIDTGNLHKSCITVFVVIFLHMLFLFLLLKNIYCYGYERDLGILANMCLYSLVLVFTWQQLNQTSFHKIAATIFTFFFIVIIVRGF